MGSLDIILLKSYNIREEGMHQKILVSKQYCM